MLRSGLVTFRRFSSASPSMTIAQVRNRLHQHVSALQKVAVEKAQVPDYPTQGHSVEVGRDKVIIPLKSEPGIRLQYTNYKMFTRLGMILEDLDTFAVWIAYKHNQAASVPMGTPAHEPMCIVTACVDKIDFHDQDIQSDQDIEMHGHVSWVGRSSIEVTMTLKQKPYDSHEPINLLTAKFVMVSRHPTFRQSVANVPLALETDADRDMFMAGLEAPYDSHEPINLLTAKFVMVSRHPTFRQSVANVPLALETDADRDMFMAGLEAVQRRKHFERNSLLTKPPSSQERFVLHDIFLKTIDQKLVPAEEVLRTCNAVWNVINALGSGLLLLCLLPEFLYSLLFFGIPPSVVVFSPRDMCGSKIAS
uniref:HotDog ACOT-type domain-containing protein n=1 Tax=Steinernema glaseri TaxID=37863 RepID=A0A1I7YH37_9BILA